MSIIAKKIIFNGTVQGVGFRFVVLNTAEKYGIEGYVRNMPDGSVEMFAQGSENAISNCAQDIKNEFEGYVRDMEVTDEQFDASVEGFRIRF